MVFKSPNDSSDREPVNGKLVPVTELGGVAGGLLDHDDGRVRSKCESRMAARPLTRGVIGCGRPSLPQDVLPEKCPRITEVFAHVLARCEKNKAEIRADGVHPECSHLHVSLAGRLFRGGERGDVAEVGMDCFPTGPRLGIGNAVREDERNRNYRPYSHDQAEKEEPDEA